MNIHFFMAGFTPFFNFSFFQLLESPGSCYSYGDMPIMGIYSPSEGSASFSSTAHVFPWSSSESYASYSSSAEYPSNLISPAMHNHTRTPLLTARIFLIFKGWRTFHLLNA